jgi:hypothetical protein
MLASVLTSDALFEEYGIDFPIDLSRKSRALKSPLEESKTIKTVSIAYAS